MGFSSSLNYLKNSYEYERKSRIFLGGKKDLSVKILDKSWLDDFHKRIVVIKPEDALLVTLRTTHTYSPNFDEKKTDCEVVKVLSVIAPNIENSTQMEISNG